MTAVEWLLKELDINPKATILKDLIEQAKEMEKEQIIDACNQTEFEDVDGMGIHDTITKGEEYYNETFKTKKMKSKTLQERADKAELDAKKLIRKQIQDIEKETLEEVKDLAYYRANAEEDYMKVPISVLRYISELEEKSYSEEEVKELAFNFYYDMSRKMSVPENLISENFTNLEEWFEQFKKK
jgi:hypothetical protein